MAEERAEPTITEIINRLDESLRRVRETDGEVGRVNSRSSMHLAQSNVLLADWAAKLPDDLAPHYPQPSTHRDEGQR